MFFIVLVLFFSKYFSINSLRCMSHPGFLSSPFASPCEIEFNINDAIPDDDRLIKTHKCAMRDADKVSIITTGGGSCYGEIVIDYNAKKMVIKLTDVDVGDMTKDPYDDMFGYFTGIQSVVQYKITGNLNKELRMATRIQCKTSDNCALEKLRKLLSNITISDRRQNLFKELSNFLDQPESTSDSELICDDDDNTDVECSAPDNRCQYRRIKTDSVIKGCVGENPTGQYDIEYRFNVIEEMDEAGTDTTPSAYKLFYACHTDHCNSDESLQKVENLLNAIAMASPDPNHSVKPQVQTNSKVAPQVQTNNKVAPQVKPSDGVTLFISFYSRSIVIFSLFIQIFSN